eukprot:13740701-Alexandrium_andersonii.AAC.1
MRALTANTRSGLCPVIPAAGAFWHGHHPLSLERLACECPGARYGPGVRLRRADCWAAAQKLHEAQAGHDAPGPPLTHPIP